MKFYSPVNQQEEKVDHLKIAGWFKDGRPGLGKGRSKMFDIKVATNLSRHERTFGVNLVEMCLI